MKTAIAAVLAFGAIISLVVYGTSKTVTTKPNQSTARVQHHTPPPKIIETVKVIERIKIVEVPVTKVYVKETTERVVETPPPPPVSRPVYHPEPAPEEFRLESVPPRPVIVPVPLPQSRPAYRIPSPRRPFCPPRPQRISTARINHGYNHYRGMHPNYRRY